MARVAAARYSIFMSVELSFEEIDRRIEILQDKLEGCRQALLLARAAIWGGGFVLVLILTIAGTYRTPTVVAGAIAALLGGTVWFGSNVATREETEAELADAEAAKARLFDEVAARNGWRDLTPSVH